MSCHEQTSELLWRATLLAVLPAIQAMEQLPVTLGIQSITQFNHVMRGRTQHSISAHRANGELHIERYWD